jgi:putative ABC transport system substrate-binding protein
VRPARIATLDDANEAVRAPLWASFRRRLGELGYKDGTDFRIEASFANGDLKTLDGLAASLVASKPNVIVAVTTTAGLSARKATADIPIVVLGAADPVKSGLVESLARPGGNVTGASPNQAELPGKWLQLVRELVPAAKSVAFVTDRGNPGEMLVFHALERAASSLGVSTEAFDGVTSRDVDKAFAGIAARRTDAMIVGTTTRLLAQRKQLVDGAARARIPAVYARREYPASGGLLSYGSETEEVFVRGAEYVDRILRGARPAELPFEMAATFKLVLNMRTAGTLGLVIPDAVRMRADEIIQ